MEKMSNYTVYHMTKLQNLKQKNLSGITAIIVLVDISTRGNSYSV